MLAAVLASTGCDSGTAAVRPSASGSGTTATVGGAAAGGGPALPTVPSNDIGAAGDAPSAVGVDGAGSVPARIAIPAIRVTSGLQPLGLLRDGSLAAPSRWQEAGWFAEGVRPGDVGPAVIAGHVDSTKGPAVFFRLTQLHRGERVYVTRRDGRRLTFVVDRVAEFPKRHFPTAYVYGPTPDPQLRLVTCTGDFDPAKHSYVDNLVVSAHLQ